MCIRDRFTTSAFTNVQENQTVVGTAAATDADGSSLTFTLAGAGADNALFNIASGGAITFKSAPDFETPLGGSSDNSNDYVIQVTATDGGSLTDTQTITISVTNANEAPVITNGDTDTANFVENATSTVIDVAHSDVDSGDSIAYTLTGSVDDGLFNIVEGTGVITFKSAPDFETPLGGSSDNSNDYVIQVTATDGGSLTDTQTITISVTNVNLSLIHI